jgi:hypothetical protein
VAATCHNTLWEEGATITFPPFMAGFLLTTLYEPLYFTCADGCATFKKQRGEVTHGISHTMTGVFREHQQGEVS